MKPEQKTERQPLDAEMEKFESVQAQLQSENPEGGYVVIKGDEVLGVWRDRVDALGEGIKKYGNVVFLVRNISDAGDPVYFSRNIFAPC